MVSVTSRIKDGIKAPIFDSPTKETEKHVEFFKSARSFLEPIKSLEKILFSEDDVHFIVKNVLNASY